MLLYDGKYIQKEATKTESSNPMLTLLSRTKVNENTQVFSFCMENPELYKWSFVSSSSTFSLLIVGYTTRNSNYHTQLSVSAFATKCQGSWAGGLSGIGNMEFVHGCSIRQDRPYRGTDVTKTLLTLMSLNVAVSQSMLIYTYVMKSSIHNSHSIHLC